MHCNGNSKTIQVGFGLYVNLNGKLLGMNRRRKERENGAQEVEEKGEVGREMEGAKDRGRNIYVCNAFAMLSGLQRNVYNLWSTYILFILEG